MLIFDDTHAQAFYPLCLTRSVGDLRCGILKLRQRLQELEKSDETELWVEPRLASMYRDRHPEWKVNSILRRGSLAVNSRLRCDPEHAEQIKQLGDGEYLVSDSQLIAFRARQDMSELPDPAYLAKSNYKELACKNYVYADLPSLIHDNERMLRHDFERYFYDQDNYFETEPGVTTLHPYNIWIGENVELKPGVVLDASDGPIVIDEGARVMPNAVIVGPVYIGKRTVIKVGAKIYGPTSIGPVCKVGGEVEGSIIQAYTNKQHDGFLGHSYVGEWVNIGADTNNSDLKNTYKPVSYYSYRERQKISSGTMFLGALIGDYVKLGINMSLNTGVVIGVGSNLWGAYLITGFVPDFAWGNAQKLDRYRWDEFCNTARTVKVRRNLELSITEQELLLQLYNSTEVTS